MTTKSIDELLETLGFAELQNLVEAGTKRQKELRVEGVVALAEKFEEQAAQIGLTAKKVLAEARKKKRAPQGRGRKGSNDNSEG